MGGGLGMSMQSLHPHQHYVSINPFFLGVTDHSRVLLARARTTNGKKNMVTNLVRTTVRPPLHVCQYNVTSIFCFSPFTIKDFQWQTWTPSISFKTGAQM